MRPLDDDEVARVRALQRLAYDCAEEVAAGLRPGVTEREAVERLGSVLRARGADGFFHQPFAWFGDRAGFRGFVAPSLRRPRDSARFTRQFFPTERRLEEGMAVILDVAPIQGGLCVDIGYAFACGAHPEQARARAFLLALRRLILERVRAGATMRQIYLEVDDAIADAGYECAHALYPWRVLGHRVGRVRLPWLRAPALRGFDPRTYLFFGELMLGGLPGPRRTPLWNGSRRADEPAAPGLWAIEPHIRRGDFGAKWEEILVVDAAGARWLDDDLPHARPAPVAA